jgi:hypothetical protein
LLKLYYKINLYQGYVCIKAESLIYNILTHLLYERQKNFFEDYLRGLSFWSVSIIGLLEFCFAWLLLVCNVVFAIAVSD